MNTNVSDPLRCTLYPDAWLTEQLGHAAWKVERDGDGEPLSGLKTTVSLFAYAKVDVADVAMLWNLSDKGFRVVDVALMLEGSTQEKPIDGNLRFAIPSDYDAVARIAGSSFRYSRFHLDPLIPLETANIIKSEWATNYFAGKRGDSMVVAERDGQVVGFTQLFWRADDCLVIDLIGVDSAYQGQGIGRDMIAYAFHHGIGDDRQPAQIGVGTQAANIPSVRLYESLGFRLIGAQYVLHYHSRRAVEE